jgi:signal peptidase I
MGAQIRYRSRHGRRRRGILKPDLGSAVRMAGHAALAGLHQAVLAAGAGLILWSVAPAALGWTTTVVTSGSMAPAVRTGDLVVSSPVARPATHRLTRGTVVLVKDPANPDKLLLHRLVGYRADGSLITKGDANRVADSTPVPAENVRGRARIRIPMAGLPVVWVKYRQYVPVAALGVLVAIVLCWRPARRGGQGDG